LRLDKKLGKSLYWNKRELLAEFRVLERSIEVIHAVHLGDEHLVNRPLVWQTHLGHAEVRFGVGFREAD
jgi:hypothetical protein